MIIVTDTTGLWGNQLWAYSSAIALAKECNTKVIVTIKRDFYEAINVGHIQSDKHLKLYPEDSFVAKRVKWLTGFLRYRTTKEGLLKKILIKLPIAHHELFVNENDFVAKYKKNHLYFMNSWEQRDNKKYFLHHANSIRHLFQPNPAIVQNVNERFLELRKEADIIVGIHFRRADDYKTWHGGKYFFDDSIFLKAMQQMTSVLKQHKILFYIFSDKDVDTTAFKGINTFFIPGQNPMSDLWAMSQCNYLIGPLSTFSMWASFWNKVPICFIEKNTESFSLDDFNTISAQDLFEKGKPVK